MIEQSFVFLDRISFKGEKNILSQVNNWEGFLKVSQVKGISKKAKLFFDRKIKQAKKELYSERADYFVDKLPKKEMKGLAQN